MSNWIRTLKSPIGTKALMAITGLVLFGFVIVHMLGNLQVFVGPQAVNDYAHFLKSKPALLWGARAFLAATFVPLSSEVVLVAVLKLHPDLHWTAVGLATLCNTLGGMTTYLIGCFLARASR